jgi:hypothetical protein
LVNQVHLDFLEPQDRKETWVLLDQRVALACRDLEETLGSLVTLESQEKWDLQEKME